MWIPVMLAVLSAGAAQDTVFPVQQGVRLEVENQRGDVSVTAWNRDAVAVGTRAPVEATRTGTVLRIRPERRARGGDTDLQIRIPAWMAVRIVGNQMDVSVRGSRSEISVETVTGEIAVDGGAGLVALRTVQGAVEVRNARGRIEVVSVNDDIRLTAIQGEIAVEATNGDITLRDIRSSSTGAKTLNGDVRYAGTIADDGRYAFTTHNGDVLITVPDGTNATVAVSTYHGEFESSFPVRMSGSVRDRRFDFTLGSGSARMELESFNGEIRLVRP